ncbi:hypothetical protein NHQ30_005924 [Ciborinia camelliae]|nr:hypothetical protein NHQ30_005924 [Ciborinia camelliae]
MATAHPSPPPGFASQDWGNIDYGGRYYVVPASYGKTPAPGPNPKTVTFSGSGLPIIGTIPGSGTGADTKTVTLDYGDPQPRIWPPEGMPQPPDPSESKWSYTVDTATNIAQILQMLELGDLVSAQAKSGQIMTPPRCSRDYKFPEILAVTTLAKMQENGFSTTELPSLDDAFEMYHSWNMYIDRAGLPNSSMPWGFRDTSDSSAKRNISWMGYQDIIAPNFMAFIAIVKDANNVTSEASAFTSVIEYEVKKDIQRMLRAQEIVVKASSFMKSLPNLFS